MTLQNIQTTLTPPPQYSFVNNFASKTAPSSFTANPTLYPKGVNTATYALDKAVEIFSRDFEKFKDEPSVTWVGKLVDWTMGWGKYRVKKIEDCNQKGDVMDKVTAIKKTSQILGGTYVTTVRHGYNCDDPGKNETYSQDCEFVVYVDPSVLSSSSNDPNQFWNSWTECIIQKVISDYYYVQVGNSTAAKECLFEKGKGISQGITVDGYGTTVGGLSVWSESSSFYFVNQFTTYFSGELMTKCYENNLIQNFDNQSEPEINYYKRNLDCASGSVNVQYFNEWCTRNFVMNNFQLILSLFDGPSVPFPFYNSFISDYCECSVNAVVIPYFQALNTSSKCSLFSNNQTLTYPIDSDGSFTLTFQNGFPLSQLKANFSIENIQQCYNQSYQTNHRKFNYTIATIGMVTIVGLAALTTTTAYFAWKTRCFQTLEIQKKIKTALHQKKHKGWEDLM